MADTRTTDYNPPRRPDLIRSRTPLYLALTTLIPTLLGCPGDEGSQCPSMFKAGELCPLEDVVCHIPGSLCEDTTCTCTNQVGGLYWDCSKVPYCRCTCPCGKIAVNTCEGLGCTITARDPCPARAQAICDVVCMEPDGGPDQGTDIGVDRGAPDLPPPDLPLDLKGPDLPGLDLPPPDLPPPDLPPDAGAVE